MTDEQAFLTAIAAAPSDRLPQYVFADWLDEAGRPADAARMRSPAADTVVAWWDANRAAAPDVWQAFRAGEAVAELGRVLTAFADQMRPVAAAITGLAGQLATALAAAGRTSPTLGPGGP